jgi:hypothetical protein
MVNVGQVSCVWSTKTMGRAGACCLWCDEGGAEPSTPPACYRRPCPASAVHAPLEGGAAQPSSHGLRFAPHPRLPRAVRRRGGRSRRGGQSIPVSPALAASSWRVAAAGGQTESTTNSKFAFASSYAMISAEIVKI